MKKPVSMKLPQEVAARVENLAAASKLKKNTIIEMCIAMHLPELEKRYAKEIAELAAQEAAANRLKKKNYPANGPQGHELNEGKR